MERPSRLEATRRKLRLARYAVVAASTVAFGGFVVAARAGHAGKSTATASNAVSQSSVSSNDDSQSQSFDYGSSSLAPSSSSAPLVQSSGS
jgi:hypothetical protein